MSSATVDQGKSNAAEALTRIVARGARFRTMGLDLALALLAALAMAALVRGRVGPDDGFVALVAHLWRHGAPPYINAFDVKPPGYFALLALAQSLFGESQATLDGLTAASHALGAFCLLRIGRRLGARWAGVFAGLGFPVLSTMLAVNAVYPPLAAATAAAFALALSDVRGRILGAGIAVGVAATIKQTAALEGVAVFWLVCRASGEGARARAALTFLAGAALAPMAFALEFAALGGFAPFLRDVVALALQRPGIDAGGGVAANSLAIGERLWPLTAFAALGALRCLRPPAGLPRAGVQALALWLMASWLELGLQNARWTHYVGPSLAPSLLLAGLAVEALLRRAPAFVKPLALAALLAGTVATAWPLRSWAFLAPDDIALVEQAADIVRARQPAPGDRLLAIPGGARINIATNLAPPTPYIHWMHLVCPFPGAGPSRLREAIEAAPRFVVAPGMRFAHACEDMAAWRPFYAELQRHYRRIGQAPAYPAKFIVYERMADAGAP